MHPETMLAVICMGVSALAAAAAYVAAREAGRDRRYAGALAAKTRADRNDCRRFAAEAVQAARELEAARDAREMYAAIDSVPFTPKLPRGI